jgi:hypothetical protein
LKGGDRLLVALSNKDHGEILPSPQIKGISSEFDNDLALAGIRTHRDP